MTTTHNGLTDTQWRDLTTQILELAKLLAPRQTPARNPDTTTAWTTIIARQPLPPTVWLEAVRLWATDMADTTDFTPATLKRAAKTVMDRWETNPRTRAAIRAHREKLADERDRQLRDGTFATIRGYQPLPKPQRPKNKPQAAIDAAKRAARTHTPNRTPNPAKPPTNAANGAPYTTNQPPTQHHHQGDKKGESSGGGVRNPRSGYEN